MKNIKNLVISICALSLIACSESQTPTTYGAAAGGVLGAGLGAIVGSQVGNAGVGLAIGAASGAAAGAAVGHAIEGQDARIASNEERLTRQEELIKAQRAELNSLRGVSYDTSADSSNNNRPVKSASFGSSTNSDSATRYASASEIAAAKAAQANSARARINSSTLSASTATSHSPSLEQNNQKPVEFSKPSSTTSFNAKTNNGLAERDLVAPVAQIDGSGNTTVTSAVNRAIDSSECSNADSEIQKADKVIDSSDKLFHIRRALRLCPSNADYHAKLGDLYMSMNRADDAKFEYQEALKIDPSSSSAQSGLENLQRGASSKPVTFGGGEAAKLPARSGSDRY